MNIVTFSDTVELCFTRGTGRFNVTIPPYVPHVFARPQYGALSLPPVQSKVFRSSSLAPRLEAFNAKVCERSHTRVLLYNGCGGFGDQIMTWPIASFLNEQEFDVYVLADPGNDICWRLFPWIKGVYTLPIQLETLKLFDHHAFFEIVTNTDDHPDQLHPVDTMLHQLGFDHEQIPADLKVVKPYFSAVELDEADAAFNGKDIAIYQMHSGSNIRSLLPEESAYILRALAESFPEITWVAIYDNLVGEPYKKAIAKNLPNNVELYRTPKIRVLWALTQRAKVVVAPDSMMVHIAGSLEVPCVGLWGVNDPMSRVRYYKNHLPIWPRKACNFSPCFCYLPTFPHYCPPFPDGQRAQCEVLTAITAEEVVKTVETIGLCKKLAVPVETVKETIQLFSALPQPDAAQ